MIKNLLTGVIFALPVLIIAWFAGFNFDEQGFNAAILSILTLLFFCVGFIIPKSFLKWRDQVKTK